MATMPRSSRTTTKRSYTDLDASSSDETSTLPSIKPKATKRARKTADEGDTYALNDHDEGIRDVEVASNKKVSRKPKTKKQVAPAATINKSGPVDPKWKNTRGKRGLLQAVAEFPLDLLYEIFAYLLPSDILSLSRTTKDLRALLMTQSSASIWKTARENLTDFPPCPNDLNEAQYVNLMFSNHCHHCLALHTVHTIFWNSRTRACQSCFDTLYRKTSRHNYYERIRYNDILPRDEISHNFSRYRHKYEREVYLISNLEAIESTERKKREQEGDKAAEEWLISKWDELKAIRAHTELCKAWHQRISELKDDERERLRRERQEQILSRLSEAGWGDEIEAQEKWEGLSFLVLSKPFKDSKPVTDRIWMNMKDKLIASVEERRVLRLEYELKKKWQYRHCMALEWIGNYLTTLPLDTMHPPISNIVAYPSFRTVLLDTPIDEGISEEMLHKPLVEHLSTITSKWLESAKEELLQLIRPYKPNQNLTLKELELANLAFTCSSCGDPIRYPHILFHSCLSKVDRWRGPARADAGTIEEFNGANYIRPWSCEDIKEVRFMDASFILACGLDPETTTQKMMDDLAPLLEQPQEDLAKNQTRYIGYREEDRVPRRIVYSWRQALDVIELKETSYGSESSAPWVMLNSEDTIVALSLRKRRQTPLDSNRLELNYIICNHCPSSFKDSFSFSQHVKHNHGHSCTHEDWRYTAHLPLDYMLYQGAVEIILPQPESQPLG